MTAVFFSLLLYDWFETDSFSLTHQGSLHRAAALSLSTEVMQISLVILSPFDWRICLSGAVKGQDGNAQVMKHILIGLTTKAL